jgi:polysaccharide transporter, PST family
VSRQSLLRYAGFAFSVTGARVAGIAISSITFPFVVRRLGVEMYGLWSYVVAVCAFLDIVADPGLTTYVCQQLAARRTEAFDLISDYLFLRFLSASVAAVVVLVVASLEVRPDVRHLLRLYGIGLLLVNLLSADHLLSALEKFHVRSLLIVSQQILYALGLFAFVKSAKDVAWIPVSILVSSAFAGVLGWFTLFRDGYKLKWILRPRRWKSILVPSFHYAASSLMSAVYHRSGHVLVRMFLGDYLLGLYSAAVRLVDILRNFVSVLLQVLTPRFALSAKSGAAMIRLSSFAIAVTAIISIPLTVGLISTASLVVPLALGAKYQNAVSLVRWMAPYIITASAASLLSGTILYASGRHRAYFASTAGGAFAGVLLYTTLIPTLGLSGAAIAFVMTEFVVAGLAYVLLPKELRGLWKDPTIAISCAAALLMLITVKFTDAHFTQPFVVISAGTIVYLMSCALFLRKWFIEQLG